MKVIFLDIDGVLNGHEWCHVPRSVKINQEPARCLQSIVDRSGAKIVLASSWSSLVRRQIMTCDGFRRLLESHGIECEVIDAINVERGADNRRKAVGKWLSEHKNVDSWVHIDDLPIGGERHIRPNPGRGLDPRHATEALELLS